MVNAMTDKLAYVTPAAAGAVADSDRFPGEIQSGRGRNFRHRRLSQLFLPGALGFADVGQENRHAQTHGGFL